MEHCEKKLTTFWYKHVALYLLKKKSVSIDKDCKITVDVTSKKKNGTQAEPSRILAVGSNQTISIEKSLLVKTPKLKKKNCKKTMLIKKLYLCDICKQNCEEISLAFQDNSIKCESAVYSGIILIV